jgi:hypothetical protein
MFGDGKQPLAELASKRDGTAALLRGLLVLSCLIVVTLFATELLLRAIDFSIPSRSEVGEAYQFDSELGWLPVPSAAAHQTTGNRTISVKHNSLGLRERELSDIAPDRILFLGDSFTMVTTPTWMNDLAISCRKSCHSMA